MGKQATREKGKPPSIRRRTKTTVTGVHHTLCLPSGRRRKRTGHPVKLVMGTGGRERTLSCKLREFRGGQVLVKKRGDGIEHEGLLGSLTFLYTVTMGIVELLFRRGAVRRSEVPRELGTLPFKKKKSRCTQLSSQRKTGK